MKIQSPFLIRCGAWFAISTMRLIISTCRLEYRSPDPKTRLDCPFGPDVPERYVVPVWHDLLLFPTFTARRSDLCCGLVSRHDGASFLSTAIEMLGGKAIRGSSRKGANTALKQMLTQTDGYHILITPDGPMGPRRQMKQGAIFMASNLQRRIVPTAYWASRVWRIKGSWTDIVIPKPFSKIMIVSGEAISIPPELSREDITYWTNHLQQAMDQLHAELEASTTTAKSSKIEPDQTECSASPQLQISGSERHAA